MSIEALASASSAPARRSHPFSNVCTAISPSHACRLNSLASRDRTRASAFRGVSLAAPSSVPHRIRWSATVCERGRVTYLGTYDDERWAAVAYDVALILLGYPPQNYAEQAYRTAEPTELCPVIDDVARRLGRFLLEPKREPHEHASHLFD